jgi:hypothetical protein
MFVKKKLFSSDLSLKEKNKQLWNCLSQYREHPNKRWPKDLETEEGYIVNKVGGGTSAVAMYEFLFIHVHISGLCFQ